MMALEFRGKLLRGSSIRFSPPSLRAWGRDLGLSIVYGIVKQHGGEVTFENLSTGGARFVVELPVLEIPANERQPAVPEFASDSQPVRSGRILVVEDEPSVAQLIVDVLREEGHQVEAVLESQEGLARLIARALRPGGVRFAHATAGWSGVLRSADSRGKSGAESIACSSPEIRWRRAPCNF